MPERPPEIPVEVLPPESGVVGGSDGGPGQAGAAGGGDASGSSGPEGGFKPVTAFHPLAAGIMILVDGLWGILEIPVATVPFTVVGCFVMVFVSTLLIQRRRNRDRWLPAFLKAMFLGAVAAVPFPVMGTSLGIALLAWFGIKHPAR